ncbi:hypothetical protein HJC23_000646 [Cyclotella cryptica]|uniref:Coenzyme Q-binding protein COQ10 START domain-containing protein n=1 Tax=Cyclotella cryptica TaxID=29204 RepID=A0ABD3Q7B2_9STRA|eukprot:CCRYP_008043-RA/>CCRYP_008043-RA protein AED:0.29 eAED:-0.23 QI:0/0/0/1/1/1/3/0/293
MMCRSSHILLLLTGIQRTWAFRWTDARRPHFSSQQQQYFGGIFEATTRGSPRSTSRDRSRFSCSARSSSEQEVDLYENDNGQERIDLDDIDLRLEWHQSGVDDDGNDEMLSFTVDTNAGDTREDREDSKKLIECNASILLPFPADVAFDAFSDLTRQPSWCKYLKSVEYIGVVGEDINDGPTEVPLRQSKWTVGVKGLRFTWTARDTHIVRPHRIEWESTSGMKNRGSVEFTSHASHESEHPTKMTLRFIFVTPRVVSSLFRRSTLIRRYTEEVLLMNMLTDFRDVVLQEDIR